MASAQKSKEGEITEQASLLLIRNLLRVAVFNISYIRGLFPESFFKEESVPALGLTVNKLSPMDAESRRLINWMEKGVYDSLQKKYLRTLVFCICEDIGGPTTEEYFFSFRYPNSGTEEVSMKVNLHGDKSKGDTFTLSTMGVTPDQMRSSACRMIRNLTQLMKTLDHIPAERSILMKLLYYDDITPGDYQPPFFRCCSDTEAYSKWTRDPLKIEVGNVSSKYLTLALKIRSVLDPCGDESDDVAEDEIRPSSGDQLVVAPIGEKSPTNDNGMASDADTQDAAHEEEQTARVKEWILSKHTSTVDLADVLSNFQDLSVALTEDIMKGLMKEELLFKTGKDSYSINKEKALYHAFPADYVTVSKLHNKLDGEADHDTVQKLTTEMAEYGYVKNSGNKRLGKRVVHSGSTKKKLEVEAIIDGQTMPLSSLRSGVARKEAEGLQATKLGDDNNSTLETKLRKRSMVNEPIYQDLKRQKSGQKKMKGILHSSKFMFF